MIDPSTARELQCAMDRLPTARRTNPRAGPYLLESLSPDPEQRWRTVGRYHSEDVARDEFEGASGPPGTVFRLSRSGAELGLSFVHRSGALVPAPPLPDDAPGRGWYEVWEGPRADGSWMAYRCEYVPRELLVLAVCACAREALPVIPASEDRPLGSIEAAERWCRGEATIEVVREACYAAYVYAGGPDLQRGGWGAADVSPAAVSAAYAASDAGRVATEASRYIASVAAGRAVNDVAEALALSKQPGAGVASFLRYRRRLAPLVRRYISLGALFLSRP